MIKLKLSNYISINFFLFAIGVIAILVGIIINDKLAGPLLESLGTGLVAAGLINILDRTFFVEPPAAPPPPPSLKERIILSAESRVAIPKDILDLKYNASKVDIIGVGLNNPLDELVHDHRQRMINNLLFHNLQFRLYLLHPRSNYLFQRAAEDHWEHEKLMSHQIEAVRLCVEFYRQLQKRYEEARNKGRLDTRFTGSLQIKLLEFCPYISIYRVNDDRIYWGPYLSGVAGMNLPLFLTTPERDPLMYNHLHNHIHGLMECDEKYPDLVRMTNVGEPQLNEALLKDLGIA